MAQKIPEMDIDQALSRFDWGELVVRAKEILNFLSTVEIKRKDLRDAELSLKEQMQNYEDARYALLMKNMTNGGQAWCSFSEHIVPSDGLQLVFIHKKTWMPDQVSGGYDDESKGLHWICPDCLNEANRSAIQYQGKEDLFYHVFEAREEEGLFLYKAGEAWMLLPVEMRPARMSEYEVSQIAEQYGIPPSIDRNYLERGGDSLLITVMRGERYKVAP